jgi:DNA-binding transcriptional regulator YbjK
MNESTSLAQIEPHSTAPGYIKIVGALKLLLKEKEFNAITWAEIARTAGVNEALIYKYFHDKRNLLYRSFASSWKSTLPRWKRS